MTTNARMGIHDLLRMFLELRARLPEGDARALLAEVEGAPRGHEAERVLAALYVVTGEDGETGAPLYAPIDVPRRARPLLDALLVAARELADRQDFARCAEAGVGWNGSR